ncbi:MAG TPA: NYN domain-containing protein [Candidatus Bathyarchaeia archaeon]|nr:NYN domain-containing protein [Candidatus Bathyarchaeia archaeon]
MLRQPLLYFWHMKRTFVYIDGFNLFYRGVKHTPFKWLDLKILSQNLLSQDHCILKIKYFTANITGRDDLQAPVRQQTYLRALAQYIPEISIHYGKFLSHKKWARLAAPRPARTKEEVIINGKKVFAPLAQEVPEENNVEIIKTEEKGSDVNLAVHLVNDAWLDVYDCALVISNDSDLVEAINLVKKDHPGKLVGVAIPHRCFPSKELIDAAHFQKRVRKGVLQASQLPNPIPGTNIHKPEDW